MVNSMVMVSSNETIKKVLNPTGEHNVSAYLLAGAISGALAGAFTNPLDVAKTRLQTQTMETECVVMQECVSRSVGVQVAGASPGNVETMASKEVGLKRWFYGGLMYTCRLFFRNHDCACSI